uniref:receptor protein-tyrosine kinase n=1 Tax=Callorhinchus milii TaxID=7868 RepID=A0A4W3HWK1_CALMI
MGRKEGRGREVTDGIVEEEGFEMEFQRLGAEWLKALPPTVGRVGWVGRGTWSRLGGGSIKCCTFHPIIAMIKVSYSLHFPYVRLAYFQGRIIIAIWYLGCISFLSEKGFINSTSKKEVYVIGKNDYVCIEATLNAYPLVNCQWYFLQKTFPCELKNLHGNRYNILKFHLMNVLIKCKAIVLISCEKNITKGIQTTVSHGKEFGSMYVISELDTSTMKDGCFVKCCVSNAIGSICKQHYLQKKGNVKVKLSLKLVDLNKQSLSFSSFKQPGYERHLHMIQSVGPTDNDYIYVDFSHFDYDLKWEFPRENLKLGNILGSGAFGKVVEATAYGIIKANIPVQVAVKMLKEKYEPSEKDAIMSELKMMIHMGNHENIMNLLGACTVSGPVYLIFEYCCYGDLLNYLRNNRETFHKTLTDVFAQNNFSFYHNLHTDRPSRIVLNQPQAFDDTCAGACSFTEETNVLNVTRYDDEDLQILTFEDLLSFSYQVAKGMEFLASRSCIHRDLAARNVLVTHGKVVKICDFGLARDVMQDSNYVIKGSARLPVKWMAPESLFEGSYTIHSDIWSYGILLWEIFSLGVNPYPGIQVDAYFYKLIQSGFKMDQPFYANEEIYNVMQSCWTNEPGKRPAFQYLVAVFEKQLADAEVAVS